MRLEIVLSVRMHDEHGEIGRSTQIYGDDLEGCIENLRTKIAEYETQHARIRLEQARHRALAKPKRTVFKLPSRKR